MEAICNVLPARNALKTSQDRLIEKEFLTNLNLIVAPYANIETEEDLTQAIKIVGFPSILKTRRFGYDGKGQFKIKNETDLKNSWAELKKTSCVVEKKINIAKENGYDHVINYNKEDFNSVRNIHKNHILDITKLPSCINKDIEKKHRRYF